MGNATTILLFFILLMLNDIHEEAMKQNQQIKRLENSAKFQNILFLTVEWRADLREKLLDIHYGKTSTSVDILELLKVIQDAAPDFDVSPLVKELHIRASRIWTEIGGKGVILLKGDSLVVTEV